MSLLRIGADPDLLPARNLGGPEIGYVPRALHLMLKLYPAFSNRAVSERRFLLKDGSSSLPALPDSSKCRKVQ